MIKIRVDEVFATPLTEEEQAKADLEMKIQEAKTYLASTDYKDLPRYVPKADENIETIYRLRDEAREFIRANDVPNP